MNLMLNARDAITDGGHIWLTTSDVSVPEGALAGTIPGPGEWVALSVGDDGHGMTPEVQARMFEAFFTTRGERPGTQGSGLGLATVQRIVHETGAQIDVKSGPAEGTNVIIYFPRVSGLGVPSLEMPRVPVPRKPAPSSRRVLVIEDEPAVRSLLATILVEAHYAVMVARNGEEGLRVLDTATEPVHLIVTDLVMPRLGGMGLARALHERANRPRMVFISGYSNHTLAELEPYGELLPKPFTPAQLVAAVSRALGEDAPEVAVD
jgi:CheY-like chemotaxis protein